MPISAPRNHFPLVEDAPHVVLIAGGIGITPLACMARRLAALGRPYEIHVAARNPERAALVSDLRALSGKVLPHFDSEHNGAPLDIVTETIDQPPHPIRLALRCRGEVRTATVRTVLRPA